MICRRCQGALCFETDQHWSFWHCLTCGDRFDDKVMTNRYLSKPPAWAVAEHLLTELFTGNKLSETTRIHDSR